MTLMQNGATQNVFGKVFLTVCLRTASSVAKECLSAAHSAVVAVVSQFINRITLDNDQLDAQIFNTFITILYIYMFRAISCSSSGGQIVLIQHLVSSLSVNDRPVHKLRETD
jgi:hypothetical protein